MSHLENGAESRSTPIQLTGASLDGARIDGSAEMDSHTPEEPRFIDLDPTPQDFRQDVIDGLRSTPKTLSPRYLYDDWGSELFEMICNQPEYYVTNVDTAILKEYAREIAEAVGPQARIIELGAGSLEKVGHILSELDSPAVYIPVDISGDFLKTQAQRLSENFPEIPVAAICTDYGNAVELETIAHEYRGDRNIVFFPGSTIANMEPEESLNLLKSIRNLVGEDGGIVIGVDLRKDPEILIPAYQDSNGVTSEFNLNLLDRINAELGANFDRENFRHEARWNPDESRMESHLVSLKEQKVNIGGETIHFAEGESIHTENSYKYTIEGFQKLLQDAGFKAEKVWTDNRDYFSIHYARAG